jgi:hypothetical protein
MAQMIPLESMLADFETELSRLLALGLDQELETIARRYYSQKERESMDSEDFAGPHRSFPIKTQQDVYNAAHLIGHADNPDAVKAAIKRIAKRKGFKLPDSWEEEDSKKDDGERAMKGGDHPPFSGTHSHAHPSFGGEDDMHEHEHSHDNDADHKHSHEATKQERVEATPEAIQSSDRHVMSLPLIRIDAAKREVWGQATAEVPDSYGTIFGYCPEAWTKWRGNIREQHDPKKAVGKAIDIKPIPEERAIYVGSRVSRGAQDTWLKVEDNVLTGYSASILPDPEFGSDPRRWPKKEYNGKEYPYLPRYTVAELSLVDNPACPGCNIQIVRADGFATDVLDLTEEEPIVEQKQETQDRAGARVGSNTRSKMHESIAHTLHAAVSQMKNCDCPDCQAAIKMIDPDDDGDIDLGGYDDPDNDWRSLYDKNGNPEDMERVVTSLIERSLQPVYSRLQGIAGTLARTNALPMNIDSLISSSITRAFETLDAKLAALPTQSSLDEVRAELSAVKGRVEDIAEQPQPGGPIMNASAMPMPRAIDKTLATDPISQQPQHNYGAVYEALSELAKRGGLDSIDKQVDAMAAALAAQRGIRR